ncbi:MAG: replication initiator protein A [Cetobacterium sp.]|nr:replication initiator protein A [Cetobacterium sp.]
MTFNYRTKENDIKELHFQFPKALMFETKYKNLSANAKLLYAFLWDRSNLSVKNDWYDKLDRAFILCSLDEIEIYLNCSRSSANKYLKELISFNLVKKEKACSMEIGEVKNSTMNVKKLKDSNANILYIGYVNVSSETLTAHLENHFEKLNELKSKRKLDRQERENRALFKNYTMLENASIQDDNSIGCSNSNDSIKNELTIVQNLDGSNTEKSNTEYSMYVCSDKSQLKKSKLIELTKKHLCLSINSEKELVKFDSKIDFDLFEKVLMKIINNNKVNDKESYLIKTIFNLIDKNIVTLDKYTKSIEEYNKKYIDKKQSNLNSNNKTKNIKLKTTQHAINQTYKKYNADELENMLLNNQKSKFENTLTKKSINKKLANDNSSDQEDFEWDY